MGRRLWGRIERDKVVDINICGIYIDDVVGWV